MLVLCSRNSIMLTHELQDNFIVGEKGMGGRVRVYGAALQCSSSFMLGAHLGSD